MSHGEHHFMSRVTVLPVPRCQLGETPIWCAEERALYWIDCDGGKVFRRDMRSGALMHWQADHQVEGLVLRERGGLLAVLRSGVLPWTVSRRQLGLQLAPWIQQSDHEREFDTR
jgi:sugar lactone lactonase YvrE